MTREYAQAGVDPKKITPFKRLMDEVAARTRTIPRERRQVYVYPNGAYAYHGRAAGHRWLGVTEGLGNKNWIAEWMYRMHRDVRWFSGIGFDTAMMAVVDVLREGFLPAVYSDEVAAGTSDWFTAIARASAIAESFEGACRVSGMALTSGESPALRYLVKAELPVADAPVLSGHVTAIATSDWRLIRGARYPGLVMLGAPSSGLHSNGISLVIKRALTLEDEFLHIVPETGRMLGEEALIPTASYVRLMEVLLAAGVELMDVLPVTGDGVTKLFTSDPHPLTYRVTAWPAVPPLFRLSTYRSVNVIIDPPVNLTRRSYRDTHCLSIEKREVFYASLILIN